MTDSTSPATSCKAETAQLPAICRGTLAIVRVRAGLRGDHPSTWLHAQPSFPGRFAARHKESSHEHGRP